MLNLHELFLSQLFFFRCPRKFKMQMENINSCRILSLEQCSGILYLWMYCHSRKDFTWTYQGATFQQVFYRPWKYLSWDSPCPHQEPVRRWLINLSALKLVKQHLIAVHIPTVDILRHLLLLLPLGGDHKGADSEEHRQAPHPSQAPFMLLVHICKITRFPIVLWHFHLKVDRSTWFINNAKGTADVPRHWVLWLNQHH